MAGERVSLYRLHHPAAGRRVSAALFRGDKDAAENLKAKITHYRRALSALDPARDGRDCTNCRFLAAENTASGKRYCTHMIGGPYACSHWKGMTD